MCMVLTDVVPAVSTSLAAAVPHYHLRWYPLCPEHEHQGGGEALTMPGLRVEDEILGGINYLVLASQIECVGELTRRGEVAFQGAGNDLVVGRRARHVRRDHVGQHLGWQSPVGHQLLDQLIGVS